jgi:hypothetical protein
MRCLYRIGDKGIIKIWDIDLIFKIQVSTRYELGGEQGAILKIYNAKGPKGPS